ncbi:MAG: 5-formyltetrahydrofolate cyclo-ligase [Alphaproteobacteria bacterium]|nr:5-formyltetrahydrofolate cyclo-ligase [Alphaproteobacteria bacterium]
MRLEAIRHRDRLEPDENQIEAAARTFFEKINPAPDAIVSAYWPKGKEFNPHPIIEQLLATGRKVALPVVRPDQGHVLGFALWDGKTELRKGRYGILQPKTDTTTEWVEPDILVVPLLAFDQRGHRLGYGGGYYDATLAALRESGNVVAVGLAYPEQACLFNLPNEDHDEPLDWIITPARAYNFADR